MPAQGHMFLVIWVAISGLLKEIQKNANTKKHNLQ